MLKEKKGSILPSVIIFAAMIYIFSFGMNELGKKTDQEALDTLEKGIHRATVECYAIEGRYPPSVEYLEENYGIRIDRDKYVIHYDGFASNVMPDITVIPLEEEIQQQ